MKISIINFSGRLYGNCYNIARIVKELLSADNDVTLNDICALNISPCGKCEYGCFDKNIDCPYFNDDIFNLYDSITSSELAFYIVPNYCDYPNANFFIFNERSQCYFQNQSELLNQYLNIKKKFIVVSSTEKSNFIHAFKYHVIENADAEILFLAAKDFKKISVKGDLMDSEQAKQMVKDFIIINEKLHL